MAEVTASAVAAAADAAGTDDGGADDGGVGRSSEVTASAAAVAADAAGAGDGGYGGGEVGGSLAEVTASAAAAAAADAASADDGGADDGGVGGSSEVTVVLLYCCTIVLTINTPVVLLYCCTDCTSSLRCNTVQVTGFAYGLILMVLLRPTVSSDMMLAHRVSSKHPPAVDAFYCTLGVDEQASFLRGPSPRLSGYVRVLVQFSSLECTKYRSTTNY